MFGKARRPVGAVLLTGLCLAFLSGCLYPKENLAHNKASVREAVRNMQAVIESYQKDTGMLPIKNSTVQTPKYEKYIVDLAKLKRMDYIGELPGVAFEKGGPYYFVIQDEETDPKVKLLDLVMYQSIGGLQNSVNEYRLSHGDLPASGQVYPGFYHIDYKKLGMKAPVLQSMFSGLTLTAIVDEQGKVYADYGIDIMKTVQRSAGVEPAPNEDLREWLVRSSEFVPVKSPVYHWVNGEPQAVQDDKVS